MRFSIVAFVMGLGGLALLLACDRPERSPTSTAASSEGTKSEVRRPHDAGIRARAADVARDAAPAKAQPRLRMTDEEAQVMARRLRQMLGGDAVKRDAGAVDAILAGPEDPNRRERHFLRE